MAGGHPLETPSGVQPQPAWLHGRAGEWLIAVRAQPGARGVPGAQAHGGFLKVRVPAPAVDGKANAALIDWFAARLGLPARAFDWQSGQTARNKRLRVRCALPCAELVATLLRDQTLPRSCCAASADHQAAAAPTLAADDHQGRAP